MKVTFIIVAALSMAALTNSAVYSRPDGQDAIVKRMIAPVPGAVRAVPMHAPTRNSNDMKRRAETTSTQQNAKKGTVTTHTVSSKDNSPVKRAESTGTKPDIIRTPDPLHNKEKE
ncbi:hypothetical protein EC991_001819 [Linnemannia zychae]|nr:hypothetical protein EC991_001819 [Linnemannia zychae]